MVQSAVCLHSHNAMHRVDASRGRDSVTVIDFMVGI